MKTKTAFILSVAIMAIGAFSLIAAESGKDSPATPGITAQKNCPPDCTMPCCAGGKAGGPGCAISENAGGASCLSDAKTVENAGAKEQAVKVAGIENAAPAHEQEHAVAESKLGEESPKLK